MFFVDFLSISSFILIILVKLVIPTYQSVDLNMKNLKRIIVLVLLVVIVTKVLF